MPQQMIAADHSTARRWVLAALCVFALLLPGWALAACPGASAGDCCCCAHDGDAGSLAHGARAERVPCCATEDRAATVVAPALITVPDLCPLTTAASTDRSLTLVGPVEPGTGTPGAARGPPPDRVPTYIRHRSLLL